MRFGRERVAAGPVHAGIVRDAVQVLVREHPLGQRREGDAPDAHLAERVEQLRLDPAVEHVVRGLVDEEGDPCPRRMLEASRVLRAEYEEIPT